MKYSNNEWARVGRIRAPHGIRGDVFVDSYTDFKKRLASGSLLYVISPGTPPRALQIQGSRPHKSGWIIKFDGFETRSDAEAVRNLDLLVPETSLQQLPPGHYYPHQLIGCQVFTRSHEPLGAVKDVLCLQSNPLLEVLGPRGEILIPMVDSILVDVDLAGQRLTVDLPAGLIELNP